MATTYSITPSLASVNEAAGTATFTVTRSGTLPAETLFVSTTTTEGFETLSFASGQTSQAVSISIINDTLIEPNETFSLIAQRNSSDPVSTFLVKATFTIIDNDTNLPPTVTGQSNVSFSTNQSFGFTSLISASDADGIVASYVFSDSTPGAGHLTLDGTQISGTSVTVSASQLSRVGYATGPSVGSNQIAIDTIDDKGLSSADFLMTINVTAPTKPDLTVALTSVPPSSLSPGNAFSVSYSVTNSDNAVAGNSLATFYPSPDQTFGDGYDIALDLVTVGGLAPGAAATGAKSLIVPSSLGAGPYYVALIADRGGGLSSGQVDESNENNNTSNNYPML